MIRPNWRTWLAFAHDLAACALAWFAAFWLRFNLDIPDFYVGVAAFSLAWVIPTYAFSFWTFGLYRGLWRFASVPDLRRIISAVAVAAIVVAAFMFMARIFVPRSVLIISPILLVMIMGGSRLAYRMWREQSLNAISTSRREPLAVIGAGVAAVNLIKELSTSKQWRVAAVFDDDQAKIGRQLQGVRILGAIQNLPDHIEKLGVRHAIIAMPGVPHSVRRRALEICNTANLKVMTVPSYDDLMSGKVTVSQIRHVELDDLLGRDPVVLDTAGLKEWITDRVVMVTGAGGSIGSELCRQLARFSPRTLVLFELNEYAMYSIEQEFRLKYPALNLVCAIGDVKDRARVEHVINDQKPSVLFHAAAYKHVPLMESENAWQAVCNNVGGTYTVANAAAQNGVEKFVFISTDKAINPTSVMGATKRLAEMVCQSLQAKQGMRFVMVRFGNVLGSTGSVIPKFREQILAGGPVTVTHPEIRRYFMSIPEAAQLVLQAGLMGKGGDIFVLDMGEPVLIADLARDLIRLSGFAEDDIKIVYSGLRPGEKLYEELLAADENTLPTPHAKLRIAKARQENGQWLGEVLEWLGRYTHAPDDQVRSDLARWLPEYRRD
ncbi:MAG: polysaccharide biosynthesis protein CapD [Betaproteobacteria bacterium]|nr:polysaccharide biosynthesis protein CapD [Betaproteobacteria bacterium]